MAGVRLVDRHDALGARYADFAGARVVRGYGDTAAEYAAARSGAAVVERGDRVVIQMTGRDPVKMIHGLVSNDVAGAPENRGVYATMLTPKGKMISDLRVLRRPERVLLEIPAAAADGVREHLRKFVPPLFARVVDPPDDLAVIGVYGPRARECLAGALGADAVPPEDAPEEAFAPAATEAGEALVVRTRYTGTDGYDVLAPAAALPGLWDRLREAGAAPMGFAALEALRIEAGRPRWGAELDESVIPLEANLRERAISETKGCYTGQEVIVRILHRGHVNRHLRGLLMGSAPVPEPGAELFRPGETKAVGHVTSACTSPALGETAGLGYVRREVEPPATLRLGAPDGPPVEVVALPLREDAPRS